MTITLVQSTKKVVTGVNNTTLAYGSNVTAGNLLVNSHAQWLGGASETITTPTDTLGHTYSGITAQQNAGSFNSLRSFYVENCSGGADTVTFDINGLATGDMTVVIAEFSGVATSGALDATNTASGTSATPSGGATGTLAQSEELIWASAAHTGADTTWVEDSADGFSIVQENEGGSSNMPIATQYKVTSSNASVTPDWTLGASRTWIGHVGTFRGLDTNAPGPRIQFVGAGAQQASNTSPLSPAIPASAQSGDVMFLFCSQASSGSITFTPPADWVSIARNANATRSMTIEIFAKIHSGSESDPSVAVSTANSGWTCQIAVYRYVDQTAVEDATEVASDAAAAQTWQPTGITTQTPFAWVISAVCSKDDNALNFNTANGFTERMSGAAYDTTAGNGSDQAIGWADKEIASPGAATCPTWNESAVGNDAWVGLTIALRPTNGVDNDYRPQGIRGYMQLAQLIVR